MLSLSSSSLSSLRLPWPTDWSAIFGAQRPLIVEIGFGYGAFLLHLARQNPAASIIGLEIANQCLSAAERAIQRQKLTNVCVVQSTAETALHHLFVPGSLSQIHINFPDPWFKKRHSHRRLMQRDTLDAMVSRLQPGGLLYLATDIVEYAEMSAELLAQTPGLDNLLESAWANTMPGRVITKYEGRAAIVLRAHVEITEAISAVFSLHSDYIAYINPEDGKPFRVRQIARQGDFTSEDASLDYNQPLGTDALRTARDGTASGAFDFLSALYWFRAQPLGDKAVYPLTIQQDNDKQYNVKLRVLGRSVIKTSVGSFRTVATEITSDDKSANSYRPQVYFSDDERHVPVLIKARHRAGEITAELAGSELLKRKTGQPAAPQPTVERDRDASEDDPPQTLATPVTRPPAVTVPVRRITTSLGTLPFELGEKLNYNIYLARVNEPAATVTYEVQQRSKYLGKDALTLTVKAETTPALQSIFVARDQITSVVDFDTLLPFVTDFNLQEGRRKVQQQIRWDQDKGLIIIANSQRVEIPVGTHDYLSLFYALRSFTLTPGGKTAVALLIENRPRTLTIETLKRETIELGAQKVTALALKLTTDDLQPDRYALRAWVSDDSRRLPLRLTFNMPQGAVRADLLIQPTQ